MKKYSCFFVLVLLFLGSFVNLPEPYNQIKELLPFNDHGWYVNAEPMEVLIKEHNVKTIIEVGSWMGLSARHMASLLPPDGKLYAVDHWWHPRDSGERTLYNQFLSNVIHAGLTDKIVPCQLNSLTAAATLKIEADLIYIDASHDYQSVIDDLRAWYPHVRVGGILSGDDLAWGDRGVEKAVLQFTTENNLHFETNGWFWYIIKE